MIDDGLLHDRVHADNGPVRAGKAVRVSETPEQILCVVNQMSKDAKAFAEKHLAVERERDELREALQAALNDLKHANAVDENGAIRSAKAGIAYALQRAEA
jgi:hypothetical protein